MGAKFVGEVRNRLRDVFPDEPVNENEVKPDGYLWARTVTCPYCEGLVPLSPNWRLAPGGTGVRVLPQCASGPGSEGRVCSFEIVNSAEEQSGGTVARGAGDLSLPRLWPGDCRRRDQTAGAGRAHGGAALHRRLQGTGDGPGEDGQDAPEMGAPLPRPPPPEDDNGAEIAARLAEKLPEWEALDIVPSERYDEMYCDRSRIYGVRRWLDLFSPRQLLCHGTSVEVFREMLEADRQAGRVDRSAPCGVRVSGAFVGTNFGTTTRV